MISRTPLWPDMSCRMQDLQLPHVAQGSNKPRIQTRTQALLTIWSHANSKRTRLEEGVPVDAIQDVLQREVVVHHHTRLVRLRRHVLGDSPVHLRTMHHSDIEHNIRESSDT